MFLASLESYLASFTKLLREFLSKFLSEFLSEFLSKFLSEFLSKFLSKFRKVTRSSKFLDELALIPYRTSSKDFSKPILNETLPKFRQASNANIRLSSLLHGNQIRLKPKPMSINLHLNPNTTSPNT